MLQEILSILYKEWRIEWRQKYALNGLLLYVASMVVVVVLAFLNKTQTVEIEPLVWSVLYWLMMLFVAVQVVAKSFMGEQDGQLHYLYQLARPEAVYIAKLLYNFLLMLLLTTLSSLIYMLFSQQVPDNLNLFYLCTSSGSLALAANLSLVSAIASKSENKNTILAVLGFPITVPVLLTLVRATNQSLQGFPTSDNLGRIFTILGMSLVLSLVSLLLFPVVWRD